MKRKMCKYEKGHQITADAYRLGLLRRESVSHASQILKRSIDFLGAEGVKITSLAQRQPVLLHSGPL